MAMVGNWNPGPLSEPGAVAGGGSVRTVAGGPAADCCPICLVACGSKAQENQVRLAVPLPGAVAAPRSCSGQGGAEYAGTGMGGEAPGGPGRHGVACRASWAVGPPFRPCWMLHLAGAAGARLGQQGPVEGAVLDGFEDVVGGDVIEGRKIGEGAGDFENAVVGAGAEVEVGHGVIEQAGGFGIDDAVLAQQARSEGAVAGDANAAVAVLLDGAGGHDPLPDGPGGLLGGGGGHLPVVHIRDFDMEVDAVEEGAADALAVAGDLHRMAAALPFWIPVITTGTGVTARVTRARKEARESTPLLNPSLLLLNFAADPERQALRGRRCERFFEKSVEPFQMARPHLGPHQLRCGGVGHASGPLRGWEADARSVVPLRLTHKAGESRQR